jgi:excisionase family DNA binding protein
MMENLGTGNSGLDAFADALAERIAARLNAGRQPRLLSVTDAAKYIGRTPKALRHMIANGAISTIREGGRIHLDRADLDRWIELRRTAA